MKTPLHTVLNSLQKINRKDVGLDDDEMKSLFNLAKDKKIVSMMNVHELLNQHSHNHLPLSTNAHTIFLSIYKWLKKQNKGNSLENFVELEGVLKAHDNVASQIIIHDTDSITSEERNKSANNINYNSKDAFAYQLNGYEAQNLIPNNHSIQNHSRTNTITTTNSLLDEYIPVPGANGQGGIGLLLPPSSNNNAHAMLRLIGIKLVRNQPLGITIREEDNGDFVVARILQGGCVDRQGLLHPGDIIREINGVPVRTMEQINQALRTALFNCNNPNLNNNQNRNSNDYDNTPCPRETDDTMSNYSATTATQTDHRSSCSITLKIVPNYAEKIAPAPVYVKALYDYDPRKDNLIPSRDAGLRFRQGDILEIVNKEDPNWWQARRIKSCTYHHVTNMGTGSQNITTKDTSNNNHINMSKKNHKTGSINTGMSEDGISMGIDDTNSISTSFGGGNSSVARLIPSATLAETRRAYAKPTLDIIGDFPDGLLAHTAVPLPASQRLLACGAVVTRTQARKDYRVGEKNAIFDECDVKAYLEVSRMPPFQRKCLVLIGPRGVGKACLKHMLVAHSNHVAASWSNGINREENNSTTTTLFGSAIPHTSRAPRPGEIHGQSYHFVTDRGQMEADIAQGDTYLEHGTFNEHLYGTRFDSIHAVINEKKMCIITCSEGTIAQALCNPVYTPYVVFIAAPPIDKFRGLWRTISTHTYPFRTNTRSSGQGKDRNSDTSSDSNSDSDTESEDILTSEETSGDDLKYEKKKKIKQKQNQNQNGKNESPSSSHGENSGGSYDLNAEKSWKNGHPPANIPLSSRLNSMAISSANSNLFSNNNHHHTATKKEHKISKKLPPALLLSPLRNPGDIDSHEIFEESCQLKRQYSHLFDLSIVNTNIMDTYALIIEHVEKLRTETQWVPTDWIF